MGVVLHISKKYATFARNLQKKIFFINFTYYHNMKLNKIFAAFMLIAAVAFTACNEKNPPVGPQGPGNGQDTTQNGDTTQVVDPIAPDTAGWNIPTGCLTVAQAREICAALESGATTGTKYYVKGWVNKLASKHEEGVTKYNNAVFYMVDQMGDKDDFEAYQVYGPNGSKITSLDQVLVGDYVVVYGELTNYNGTLETVGKGAAYIWKSTNPNLTGSEDPGNNPNPGEVTGEGTREKPYLLSDLAALGSPATKAWVKAYIVGQVKGGANKLDATTAEFAAPFTANDNGTNTNILLGATASVTSVDNATPLQLPSGDLRTALNLIQNESMLGKEILIYGSLEKYFGADGIKSPEYAEVGEQKIGIDPDVEQTEPQAKVVTIQEFIDAPESKEVYYELTGTIGGTINTTFGNFDLTDETATVYVYGLTKSFIAVGSTQNDKSYASLGLKEGDKITLRGFRGSYNGKIEVMGAYFVKKH